ncbi:MAG: extracellular solute-binding protein [bacterium]|nr:extracellular solute-binding protein [bacterium]
MKDSKLLHTCSILLLFLLLLPGCRSGDEVMTIRLWEFPRWREGDELDRFVWIKRQTSEFEAAHPGVKIELTELTWDRGQDKIRIATVAGLGPDIVSGSLPVEYIEAGLVEPIDDYLTPEDRKDYYPAALKAYTYKGRHWGWPWLLTGQMLFLNLDIFKERGVEPPCEQESGVRSQESEENPQSAIRNPQSTHWTYEEFVAKMKAMTFDSDQDKRIDTFGFGFTVTPGTTDIWPFLYMDGGQALSDDLSQYTFEEPPGVSGLNRLRDLVHTYRVSSPESGGLKTTDLWQAFAKQRRIACAPWGIWAIPALRFDEAKKAKGLTEDDFFDFTVVPYPTGKSGQPLTFIGVSGFIVFKQPDPARRDMCMTLAKFLTSGQNQKALSAYGVFPTRASAGNLYPDDPYMTKAAKILQNGITVPAHPDWAKIDETIQRQIQLAVLGEKSGAAALADAGAEVRTVLSQCLKITAGLRQTGLWERAGNYLYLFLFLAGAFILWIGLKMRDINESARFAYSAISPAVLIFAVFLAFPVCRAFLLAFQEYEIGGPILGNWVGIGNFQSLAKNEVFWKSLKNTLIYTAFTVPINVLIALILASLIHPLSNRMRTFFRAAYYLPHVTSVVVISMVWRWLFDYNYGLLNQVLTGLGLEGLHWLTDVHLALGSIIGSSLLYTPGGPIIIYLAALAAIPSSLHEAARIDGAGAIRRWWNITIPLLRPTTLFLLVTTSIASFQVFAQVLILTDGGPGYATSVLVHRIYTTAFRDFDFGLASAMALILFVVIMSISIVQFKVFRKEWEY